MNIADHHDGHSVKPLEIIRVLHLEDDEADAALVAKQLVSENFDFLVHHVRDKATYESALAQSAFNLILLDYQVSGYDFETAMEQARQFQSEVPVIVISGVLDEEQAVECMQKGAIDFVLKQRLTRLAPAVHRAIIEAGETTRRKRAEAALRESEERFRTLAEAQPQIVWTATPMGEIDFFNTRGGLYCGRPFDEIQGWGWLTTSHPEDRETVLTVWKTALREGVETEVEHRLLRADGVYRWHLSRAVPMQGSAGRIVKWLGTSTDIDALKCIQKKAQDAILELARSNEDLEQFAYGVSHDLQEPLRTIRGYLELLSRRGRDVLDKESMDFLGLATDGATRMQQMIQGLLVYSRIGMQGWKPVRTSMDMVLAVALESLRHQITQTEAVVTHDHLPVVWGDPMLLMRVLENLIGNAVKFHKDKESPRIHIGVESCGEKWRFFVKDNGIGIDPGDFNHIFGVFQRLHESDRYPGAGIGLAICKKIIGRHGGKLEIESKAGEGSTFYFTLPDVRSPSDEGRAS
jgi:PAS domain S-box-containing protein